MEIPVRQNGTPSPLAMRIARYALTFLLFLLPLKFGGIAAMPEASGYFPESLSGYLVSSWPAAALGIPAGVILLLTAAAAPSGRRDWLWSIGFLLAALPGTFFAQGEKEVTFHLLAYLAAAGALALVSLRIARSEPRAVEWFCTAFFAGALLTACHGFHQYVFGFEELEKFVAAEQAKGIVLPESLLLKLADRRINSFLISSNALAGMLLMAFPFALFFGKKWGSRFTPVPLSVTLFCLVFGGIILGALYLTGARSALFAAALLLGTALFSFPRFSGKGKLCGGALLLIALAGICVFLIFRGRSFASLGERADYLRTCAVMLTENPLAGGGWGSFHFRHMELKRSTTDEAARDPHNFIASYAAQSGIPAGIFVLLLLLFPLKKLWRNRFDGLKGAVFWSSAAFVLHTLTDSDGLVPALFGTFLILTASALAKKETSPAIRQKSLSFASLSLLLLFALFSIGTGIYGSCGEYQLSRFQGGISPQCEDDVLHSAPEEIMKRYRKLRRMRPCCALVPETMGKWYESRRDYALAKECFMLSWEIEPRRPSICRHLSRMAKREGDLTKAAWYRQEALRRFPKAPKKLERSMEP